MYNSMVIHKPKLKNLSVCLGFCLITIFLISSFLLVSVSQTQAAQPTAVQQIKRILADYIAVEADNFKTQQAGRLEYKLKGLDPRLSLKSCELPLEVSPYSNDWIKHRTHLKVGCESPRWSLIVGIELNLYNKIYVAQESINRQELLVGKVQLEEKNILRIQGDAYSNEAALTGQVAKRNLRSGQIITDRLVEKEQLVTRNGPVDIQASTAGIRVTATGTAMENGTLGDTIKVKNNRSKRVIKAKVLANNLVGVSF